MSLNPPSLLLLFAVADGDKSIVLSAYRWPTSEVELGSDAADVLVSLWSPHLSRGLSLLACDSAPR